MIKCSTCKVYKNKNNFYINNQKRKNGNVVKYMQGNCKTCSNDILKKWRKNRDFGMYFVYWSMKSRCEYKSAKGSEHYRDRGIKVLWESYEDFKKDMYEKYILHLKIFGKIQTTIERIDNNGNYCKENCCWATRKEQSKNKRPWRRSG